MTNVFIPPKDKFPANSCSEPCVEPVNLNQCPEECDQYTYGPFNAPATIYTYYEYPEVDFDPSGDCNSKCNAEQLTTELDYDIYQIINDEELYVGKWIIKDKVGPNKREFKDCGEYILRYCSQPPNDCYPECTHPLPPEFEYSTPGCCDPGYVKGLIGSDDLENITDIGGDICIWEPEFEEFSFFEVRLPECCDGTIETSKGSFALYDGENWATFKEYSCPFDYIKVTANCECINDIRIIVQR